MTWLGVGIACYRLGDLSQAEDALVEANILNNLDAAVWGYLSLVCLQTGGSYKIFFLYTHLYNRVCR